MSLFKLVSLSLVYSDDKPFNGTDIIIYNLITNRSVGFDLLIFL
jgi:hypothetical protein